jgi:hypothetical protein
MVKIGMAIIAITGEETYKIYSKKVFDEEKEIDSGFDDIYIEIASEMKKVSDNSEKRHKKTIETPPQKEPFQIFQFVKLDGIRSDYRYQSDHFVSPFFGTRVKDIATLPFKSESLR